MKKENIKLHFNIMKIFKYLVFIFAFFMVGSQLHYSNIHAETTIKALVFSYGKDDGSVAVGFYDDTKYYFSDNTIYYSGDSFKLWWSSLSNGACGSKIYIDGKKYGGNGKQGDSIPITKDEQTIKIKATIDYGFVCAGRANSEERTIKIIKDSTAPAISLESNSTSYIMKAPYKYAQQMTMSATASATDSGSGLSKIEYCWVKSTSNSGCTWDKSGEKTVNVETGYYLHVKATDNAKNESTAYFAANLDTTGPSITITIQDYSNYKKSHNVVLSVEDANDVSEIYYCLSSDSSNSKCTGKSTSVVANAWIETWTNFNADTLTGEYYVHIKAVDKIGNASYERSSNKVKLDNEAPTITNLGIDSSDWAQSHTVSGMTFSDNNRSGVNSSTKKYCWNTSSSNSGCTWTSFTGSSVTGSGITGEYYLHVQVSDNAGNVGYARTSSALKLDNTVPTVTIKSVSNSGNWAKNHTVNITITDAHSGNNTLYYCWSTSTVTCTGSTGSMSISGNSDTKSISGNSAMNGAHYLRLWAKDNAGNTSTAIASEQIKFDNTPPVITLPTIQEWRKSHTVNFKVTDDYSGVSAVKYCINQTETMAYSSSNSCWKPVTLSSSKGSLTFDGATLKYNGIYYLHIYAEDSVVETTKNTSKSAMTLRFDNTNPVIESLVADSSDWKQKHSFNFKINDEHSGISVIKYCLSKSTSMPELSNDCWKVYDISKETNKKEISGAKQLEEKGNDIHYLYLYVEDSVADEVKNNSNTRIELKYDNENPEIKNIVIDSNNWKQKHSVRASISDGPSGISEVRSTWCTSNVRSDCGESSSWKLYTSTDNAIYRFEKNDNALSGTYYLHIYVADKTTDVKNYTYEVSAAFLFDNEKPEISNIQIDSSKWRSSHTVTASIRDAYSGVSSIKYTWCLSNDYTKCGGVSTWSTKVKNTTGTYSFTNSSLTGEYYLHIYVEDSNEDTKNYRYEVSQLLKFDNTAPIIDNIKIDTAKYAKSHTVTMNIRDLESGISSIKYIWCSSEDVAKCGDTNSWETKQVQTSTNEYSFSKNLITGTYHFACASNKWK